MNLTDLTLKGYMEGTELELEIDLELKQLYLLMNSTLKGYMEGTELELDLELELELLEVNPVDE